MGIEVERDSSGLHLSQTKYALDLLKKANFILAKPCSYPAATGTKLSRFDSSSCVDATVYRSIVGALQYLTITRPDITYAVNQVCQFMHEPRQTHLMAVKRILRYRKSTPHFGIHITKSKDEHLYSFSDADSARCPDDRGPQPECVFILVRI